MINKAEVEAVASNIYSKHCKRGIPAKMLPKIIAAEKIKLREVDENNKFRGAFVQNPNGALYIFVNNGITNIGRKNFTIAHELGHFI